MPCTWNISSGIISEEFSSREKWASFLGNLSPLPNIQHIRPLMTLQYPVSKGSVTNSLCENFEISHSQFVTKNSVKSSFSQANFTKSNPLAPQFWRTYVVSPVTYRLESSDVGVRSRRCFSLESNSSSRYPPWWG